MKVVDWLKARKTSVGRTSSLFCVMLATVLVVCACGKDAKQLEVQSEVQETVSLSEENTSVDVKLDKEASKEIVSTESAMIVTIRINPELRFWLDAEGNITDAKGLNEDGEALLTELVWTDMTMEEYVPQLMEKAYEKGYLKADGTVWVSAEGNDESGEQVMFEKIKEIVEKISESKGIKVAVKDDMADTENTQLAEGTTLPTTTKKSVVTNKKPIVSNVSTKETISQSSDIEEEEDEEEDEDKQTDSSQNDENDDDKDNIDKDNIDKDNEDKVDKNPADDNPIQPEAPKSEYKLVWEEQFEGDSLNMDDWNYEYHEPGWVNAELQEYVDSPENIYVKDGNLIIQAIKTVDEEGNAYYTSGRINTQNKHDYTYGRFEVKAKVPSGKGFLPAFWMMPTDENFYGQWPKCGEIDIMEVMGHDLTKSYGTLHFGEPHTQRQGEYQLPTGDFHNDYHVFACEWDPGEFRFYVDDTLFYKTSDWFTKKEGYGEVAYPAPYDQPFYMILNLAVGGSWVGYPDADDVFADNARLIVDYVRVYEKDSYNLDVEKPEKVVVLREPDTTGNVVINGDFSVTESLKDKENWELLFAGSGKGDAYVEAGELHVESTDTGEYDYSVQIVQANQPLEKGFAYKLSFDAYADAERTIITGVTAPDFNYARYLQDTKITLTTEKQNFSFEFDMTSENDANGRVEFNLGNQNAIDTVHIDNVRLEKVREIPINDDKKTVLPDGNYVYNGQFQEGANRMNYWTVRKNMEAATVRVTNNSLVRELEIKVPAGVSGLDQVSVVQEEIAISGGKQYTLSFDAHGDRENTIQARVAGQIFDVALTQTSTGYKFSFATEDGLQGSDLEFLVGVEGTTYIDNVRIQENGMFINGDFSNGLVGYEVWNDTNVSKISYGVDGLNEDNAFTMTIENPGTEAWHIQLKQNDITLENGKWYQLTFDAKSTVDRKLMYAFQRNGLVHKNESGGEDWTPYCEVRDLQLTSDFQTVTKVFQMKEETDKGTIFSISMGAIDGELIEQKHTITIDNISLEEVEAPAEPEGSDGTTIPAGVNQMKAINDEGGLPWEVTIMQSENSYAVNQDKITFAIQNVGEEDWHIQMKQMGLTLENGCDYQLKFKVNSSVSRSIRTAIMNDSYNWFGGMDTALTAGEDTEVVIDFTMQGESQTNAGVFVSMGKIGESVSMGDFVTDIVPCDITLWDFSLVKVEE